MGGIAPSEVDEPRRPRRGTADRVDHREIAGDQVVADDAGDRRTAFGGESADRRFDLARSKLIGWRIDEVARQHRGFGDLADLLAIDAIGDDQPGACRVRLAVAIETVALQQPAQRGQRGIADLSRQDVIAGGQQRGEPPGRERIGPARGSIYAEQDSRQRPLCVGQQAMLAGAGGKTLREGEAALGRRELVLKRGPGAGRGDVNGNGGGGSGDQKTMHGALFRFRAGASGRQLRMH